MAKYYGVERSDEYLAHFGIRGMKWGIRNRKFKKWARGLKKDAVQGAKAAGLSLLMGPYANIYMSSREAVASEKQNKKKKRRS